MKRIIGIATYAVMLSGLATAATAKPPVPPCTKRRPTSNSPGCLTAPAENGRFDGGVHGHQGHDARASGGVRAAAGRGIHGRVRPGMVCGDRRPKPRRWRSSSKDDLKSRSGGSSSADLAVASTGSGGSGAAVAARHLGCIDSWRRQHRRLRWRSSADAGDWSVGLRQWFCRQSSSSRWAQARKASFPGLNKAPEIFSAKTTAEEIRAKMKP